MPVSIAASSVVAQAFRFLELRGGPASFGDDSEHGIAAAEQYDVALDTCLEAADWSFASTVISLPAASPDDLAIDPRLPHAYLLPPDALVLREVLAPDARWRLDSDGLRSDAPAPLLVRVTRRVENEDRMPGTFRTALALQLACLLAPAFLEVQGKAQALEARLEAAMARASRTDARMASASGSRGELDGDWAGEARL